MCFCIPPSLSCWCCRSQSIWLFFFVFSHRATCMLSWFHDSCWCSQKRERGGGEKRCSSFLSQSLASLSTAFYVVKTLIWEHANGLLFLSTLNPKPICSIIQHCDNHHMCTVIKNRIQSSLIIPYIHFRSGIFCFFCFLALAYAFPQSHLISHSHNKTMT